MLYWKLLFYSDLHSVLIWLFGTKLDTKNGVKSKPAKQGHVEYYHNCLERCFFPPWVTCLTRWSYHQQDLLTLSLAPIERSVRSGQDRPRYRESRESECSPLCSNGRSMCLSFSLSRLKKICGSICWSRFMGFDDPDVEVLLCSESSQR